MGARVQPVAVWNDKKYEKDDVQGLLKLIKTYRVKVDEETEGDKGGQMNKQKLSTPSLHQNNSHI